MTCFRIVVLLLYCSVAVFCAKAQTDRFYSTESGLSSSLINQLFQDSRGFIWSATEYGLNRFDGLRFSCYRHVAGDTLSIKNNYVRALFEDSRKNLFVGCMDGLMRYDRETDSFCEIPMMRAGRRVYPHVTQLQELHDGQIWMTTTGQGMFRLDRERRQALSVDDLLKQANYNYQSNFYEDSHYNIWIGTEGNGLICYLPATGETRIFKYPVLNDDNVSAILEDRDGNLFVGTQKQGLSRYDRERNRFLPVPCADGSVVSVYCLALVDGRVLVGTDGQGLKVYQPVEGCLEDYTLNAAPLDFSKGKVHTILQDRDKNLWVGLFQKGIVLIPRQQNPFEYMGSKAAYYNPIGQGCVMSLFQDNNGHLWVGTDNEGVFQLDSAGRRLRHYRPDMSSTSVANTVMCFYEDSERQFWIGSYTRGLARMNRHTGACEYPLPIRNGKILSIAEDLNKNLYIATLGAGFYRYDLLTGQLRHYESSKDETGDLKRNELANDWINCLYCDSEGLIWVGHYQGISCFNPANDSFVDLQQRNTLITGCVGYALIEDSQGCIWAGTNDGLYRYDKRSGETQRFTTSDGLANNVICGLCEDRQHNIWISTYMGISRYETAGGRFVNYYAGDGLQGNEFMHGAYCQGRSGRIYFGGVNGITCFLPEAIGHVQPEAEVWVTDFCIFNRPVCRTTLSGGHPVMETGVQDASLFRLAYNDNTFSISFSTLHYNMPEQTAYQYRMEELGPQWFLTEPGVNRITYNNLPPGYYTLRVKALHHGNFSDERVLRIVIAPPWYQTGWAYCAYGLFLALLLWGIVSYLLARMRHRREIMEREHLQQLNEAKLQFFINISHEIRTPMTLILNPLEKLLADKGEEGELRKTYLMIYRNAQRILRLINQLMDIRKLDKGQMHMKLRETDMVGFISDVMQTFDFVARQRNIRFDFRHEMPGLKVWIDLNNFDKILMNLLSNAFKYTPDGGDITVCLSTGRNDECHDALREYCEITVTDSGIGIDKDKIERIFERFYQIENDVTKLHQGTGIGLHLSRSLVQLHHGTLSASNRPDGPGSCFTIRIPLGAAHLRADELEQVQESFPPVQAEEVTLAFSKPVAESVLADKFEEPDEELRPVHAKSRLKVLVAEDENEIRDYLKEELSVDYKVLTCADGKTAYDLVLSELPDLVISDVMMPGLDGLSLCRKIKQNTTVNHIPVVLLTAKAKPEDTLEGMETGADAYMVKPFRTELLRRTVANLISNRQLLRNKFSGAQQQEDKIEKLSMRSGDEKLMEKVMRVVNEHLADPALNVEMLAAEVGLSRVHIHRKLKELTNLSTRDFIKNIRLQQAVNLLGGDQKLTISEIAYATGYTNLSHFSSSFKEKYGLSPTEYMAKYRKANTE